MIRHIVLFKLNEGVRRDEARVVQGVAAFEELGDIVPELLSWECAWNISDRPIAHDYAICSSVADQDALQRYLDHPAHQAGVTQWREFATWVIADYEI
ncbi:Dabb family protein [Streptomyces meridianus]|uniref:Dabb family protein n=1 Tax=Streptomyces meridianus TaxID=2938945 RepID=A0ABT0XCB1_9ACTN|nr:Dabb family protein [Streptomyces meridianus]MCM2580165.1 Dabb family protein [Streptomyces meridianus]